MKRFWSYHAWEALLCLAAAVTLVLNFSQGFYIPSSVADSIPTAVLVCALALLYAYLGSYNRVTMVCFSLGFVVIAGGFFLWMRQAGIDIVDQEGAATAVYIYVIAAPVIALLTFLLSRSRLGIAVLFLAGACLHAVNTFLGFEAKTWCTALFTAASVALFLLRNYRVAAMKSSTVDPNFKQYFILSAGVGVAGTVLALVLWVLVIRPLNPPVMDLELLTKYMSYDVLEMVGIARQYPIPDEWFEQARQEEQLQAGREDERENEAPEEREPEGTGLDAPEGTEPDYSDTQQLDSVTYDRDMTGLLAAVLILVLLAILSVPFVRRWLRKRRLERLTRGTPGEQVVGLYRFYLNKFARIGCPRLPAQTEREYTARYGEQLAPYTEGGVSLERMTELYLDARYGGLPIQEADCRAMAELYPVFLRNYRTLAGRFRYLTKYFVL